MSQRIKSVIIEKQHHGDKNFAMILPKFWVRAIPVGSMVEMRLLAGGSILIQPQKKGNGDGAN